MFLTLLEESIAYKSVTTDSPYFPKFKIRPTSGHWASRFLYVPEGEFLRVPQTQVSPRQLSAGNTEITSCHLTGPTGLTLIPRIINETFQSTRNAVRITARGAP